MKSLKYLSLAFLFCLGSLQLQAELPDKKQLSVSSKIGGVLVYQDRALVTRKTGKQKLKPGVYEILIKDLPNSLQDDSVRAETTLPAGIKILDVEVKSYQLEKAPREKVRRLQERLEKHYETKRSINDSIKLLKFKRNFLHSVKKSYLGSPLAGAKGKTEKRPGVQDYDRMLSYLMEKLTENLFSLRNERRKMRALNKKIALVKGEMRKHNIKRSSLTRKKMVKATLEVVKKRSFALELSYINFNVNWRPGYGIRASYKKNRTEFTGYGIVSQKSGEDWKNSALSFSTARPALQSRIPDLKPLFVSATSRRGRQIRYNKGHSTASTRFQKSIGSLVFDVPKKSDIPADGSPHRTPISRNSFPVKFEYLSIPALSPHAYMQALGRNNMDRPILEGDLNIFIENNFVGSAYTGNILPGEKFELTLSVNENIRVTRTLEEMKELKPGILSKDRVFHYSYQLKVENFTGKEIKMNLLDQIPISKTRTVEITDLKISDKPVLKTKKGILKWRFPLANGDKKIITFSFSVRAPGNKHLAFYRNLHRPRGSLQEMNEADNDAPNPSSSNRDRRGLFKSKKMPAMRKQMY